MQKKYSSEKLNVVLLSTDSSLARYKFRASRVFDKYGGAQWPSVVLPRGFNDALRFGDFGYGKVIVDEEGIVRAINARNLDRSLKAIFDGQ